MWKRSNIKYIITALFLLLGIHYLFTFTHPEGWISSNTKLDAFLEDEKIFPLSSTKIPITEKKKNELNYKEHLPISSINNFTNTTWANGAFVVLVRNSDIHSLRAAMREVEDRFNHKYNYPWVFLNDGEFSKEFKELSSAMTKGNTEYGVIPKEHWSVPSWIDYDKAKKIFKNMAEDKIIYGGSESYRHMCRFESGFFFRHPLLHKYDYYWRVEPGVHYYCDIDYDPFIFMKKNGMKYGWTISLYEYEGTIKTLWSTVKKFMKEYPQYIAKDNYIDFISSDKGETFNLCHFWSNFEIGDLNFLRSEQYLKYFEFLDQAGGFFYERWGDAPVHSIAAALLLEKGKIHFFNDIGYKHEPFMHCPTDKIIQLKCHCNPDESFDKNGYSCTGRWHEIIGK